MIGLRRIAIVAVSVVCSISWPNIAPAEWNPQTKRHVHVYLLRGFTDAFSQGIYDLANTIRNQGIDASIHNKFEWPFLADQAVRNHAEGREGSTIVIGYSLGTDAATLMADRLAQAGMPPNLVVTLDPVASIIDGEVVRVVNLCIINGAGIPLARGQSVGEQFLKLELRNRADIRRASQNTPPTLDQLILFHVLGAAAQERSRTIPENAETSTASAKRYLKVDYVCQSLGNDHLARSRKRVVGLPDTRSRRWHRSSAREPNAVDSRPIKTRQNGLSPDERETLFQQFLEWRKHPPTNPQD